MRLPKDWSLKIVDVLAEVCGGIQKGPHRKPGANPVRYLTVAHVQRNRILKDDPRFFEVTPKEMQRWRLKPLDILIIEGNGSADQIGRTALYQGELKDCVHQNHVIRVRVKETLVAARFLNAFLNSSVGQAAVQAQSMTSSGLRTLSVGRIRDISIPVPPLPEQHKIADILTTWDEALDKLDALIAVKERYKQSLMHQLLRRKKRLKGCAVKVSMKHASELFANRSERNTARLPVLSVTQDQGVVLRSGMERKITHDQGNTHTYKVINVGDYVISLRSFQGGLEYSAHNGAVSPAYHVIYPIVQIAPSFYRHYFKSVDFIGRLATAVIGIRDGKQVNYQDFEFLKLPYPDIETQKNIGAILDTCEEELRLIRAKRDALDQQKHGLMQRLLTGRVRVKRCKQR